MKTQSAPRNFGSAFVYEAQTLFLTAKPIVRYPIAVTLLAIVAFMFKTVPHFEMSQATVVYLMFAAAYGWELSLALLVMAAIFGVFKLLALLPVGVAITIVVVTMLYAGV